VPERCAHARRGGLHRRDPRCDPHLELAPHRRSAFERFQHRARHREDPRIARRDDAYAAPCCGERERVLGARELDPVVGGVAALPGLQRNAREVGPVTDQVGRFRELAARLG
jgi:hypothetical protein